MTDRREDRLLVELLEVAPRVPGADLVPRRMGEGLPLERALDLLLLGLVERDAVGVPQLDPVVWCRVVRRRDDYSAPVVLGPAREGRCADHSRVRGVRTGREDARDEGAREHLPGEAGIAADDRRAVDGPEDAAHREREVGGHGDVRESADPGGTEQSHGRVNPGAALNPSRPREGGRIRLYRDPRITGRTARGRAGREPRMVMEPISVEAAKEKARKAGVKPGRVKGTDGAIQFTKGRNNRIEVISWDEFSDVLQKRNLQVCESNGFLKIMKRE